MVVGAGRGPLVRAALNAAEKADRKIRLYAVEKNPNAIVTYVVYCLDMSTFNYQLLQHVDCNASWMKSGETK